ncbi:hypothetical protein QQF64_025988 [Cirrhinus molitorella]|uniref:Uncharacterized protein n=1 Tax=Cirrhinus molitorella TaxID=172907 RepID=A0ABR3NQJ4_9TELE
MPLGSRPVQMDDLAWKSIVSPELAADHYRRQCLQNKEDEPTLKIKTDIVEDVEEQKGTILIFYKAPNIDWARPFQAKLQGDLAIGDGINRHFLSMVMHKLQHGFTVDLDDHALIERAGMCAMVGRRWNCASFKTRAMQSWDVGCW